MNLKKLALAALAAVGMVSMPAKANAQFDRGTIETVAAMLLAEKLGMDPQMIGSLLGSGGGLGGGGSLFDLAPALALRRQAPNGSLDDIIGFRNQGLGWDAIATRTGVPSASYNRLRSSGQLDNNAIWRNTVVNELHVPGDSVSRLRGMGFGWRDIVMTTLISRESGRPLSEVANRYRSDRDWNRVSSRYGVSRQEVASRVSTWRTRRSLPAAWARNSTGWAPPGLAKKGGIPPGQARKMGRVSGNWDDDDYRGRRAMTLRSKGKGHGKGHGNGKAKGHSGKHSGRGKGKD